MAEFSVNGQNYRSAKIDAMRKLLQQPVNEVVPFNQSADALRRLFA